MSVFGKTGGDAPTAPSLVLRLQASILDPTLLYTLGIYHFLKVLLSSLLPNPLSIPSRLPTIRAEAFAQTWRWIPAGDPAEGPLAPFLPLLQSVRGVVLELGPGDGRQSKYLAGKEVEVVYGTEPCVELHGALRRSVEEAGFKGKYRVLGCRGEREELRRGLEKEGIDVSVGVFDTIVCSKVLCSVTRLEETVAGLYGLLKPGGRMVVCEHVVNPWQTQKGSMVGRAIQAWLMLVGWTWFLGGCHVDRDTGRVLREVAEVDGGWAKADLETVMEWSTLPFLIGELVKKR